MPDVFMVIMLCGSESIFARFYALIIPGLVFTITQWDSRSTYCNYGSTSCLTMAKNSTLWISRTIDYIRVFPKLPTTQIWHFCRLLLSFYLLCFLYFFLFPLLENTSNNI